MMPQLDMNLSTDNTTANAMSGSDGFGWQFDVWDGVDAYSDSLQYTPPKITIANTTRPAHTINLLSVPEMFDGQMLTPNNQQLPCIYIKGTYHKLLVKIDEKLVGKNRVKSDIVVEMPNLSITVFDTSTNQYHTIQKGAVPTGAECIADMNVADLIASYGEDMLRVIHGNCTILHNGSDNSQIKLPKQYRALWDAQSNVVQTMVKLIASGDRVNLIGEVATGKTAMSIETARSFSEQWIEQTKSEIKRVGNEWAYRRKPIQNLWVVCPPHLVQSWVDELNEVAPDTVELRVIESISDIPVSKPPRSEKDLTVWVMSRETAKLSYGRTTAVRKSFGDRVCPHCGGVVSHSNPVIIKNKKQCTHILHDNSTASHVSQLIAAVTSNHANSKMIRTWHTGSRHRVWVKAYGENAKILNKKHLIYTAIQEVCNLIVERLDNSILVDKWLEIVTHLIASFWSDNIRLDFLEVFQQILSHPNLHHRTENVNAVADLICIVPKNQRKLLIMCYDNNRPKQKRIGIHITKSLQSAQFAKRQGRPAYRNQLIGTYYHLISALRRSVRQVKELGKQCGTPLYKAKTPRRVSVADYIFRRHQDLIDMIVFDECHEFSNANSQQGQVMQLWSNLPVPIINASGSPINGYARALFAGQRTTNRSVRSSYKFDGAAQFHRDYGFSKLTIPTNDDETENFEVYSDMTSKGKFSGETSGVMPSFLPQLLSNSVIISTADLNQDIPQAQEIKVPVPSDSSRPCDVLFDKKVARLHAQITDCIKQGENDDKFSGVLWSAMNQLVFVHDRLVEGCGNSPNKKSYEIRYPDSVEHPDPLILSIPCISAKERLPKERKLLELVESETSDGNNVLVLVHHQTVRERVFSILNEVYGDDVVCLRAKSVSARNRVKWINENVVGKKAKILVANAETIKTGLNNLTWFSVGIWYQQPNSNATTYIQTNGRLPRPGQTKAVRFYLMHHDSPLQNAAIKLLGMKVVSANLLRGADVQASLELGGATSEYRDKVLLDTQIGKALHLMANDTLG